MARAGRRASPPSTASRPLGSSDAHAAAAIGTGGPVPGPHAGRPAGGDPRRRETHHHGSFHGSAGQLAMFGRQLRKYGRDARAEVGGRSGATAPAATTATPAAPGGRRGTSPDREAGGRAREDRARLAVRLPAAGRRDPARPLPVREPPPARPRRPDPDLVPRPPARSEGDVIRIGKGFSMPANGSVGTLTVSPRYVSQVRDVLEREQFDLLHFHEPFVPFLSLVLLRESPERERRRRSTPTAASRRPTSSAAGRWAATPTRLHGRIAVSAAARHFIDRYFPGDYKVIPNGVDVDRFRRAVPLARWQDGTRNLLFVGRFEPRKGLLDLLKAYRILRRDGLSTAGCSSSAPGRRSARRAATSRPAGCSGVEFLGRVSRRREGASCSGRPTSTSRRRPAASRSGSSCSRRWPPGAPIVARTSTATRASSGAAARPSSCRRGSRRRSPGRSRGCSPTTSSRARMSAAGRRRAEEFSWPRVTAKVDDYYGFVIRRLAAPGRCPPTSRAESRPRPGRADRPRRRRRRARAGSAARRRPSLGRAWRASGRPALAGRTVAGSSRPLGERDAATTHAA